MNLQNTTIRRGGCSTPRRWADFGDVLYRAVGKHPSWRIISVWLQIRHKEGTETPILRAVGTLLCWLSCCGVSSTRMEMSTVSPHCTPTVFSAGLIGLCAFGTRKPSQINAWHIMLILYNLLIIKFLFVGQQWKKIFLSLHSKTLSLFCKICEYNE